MVSFFKSLGRGILYVIGLPFIIAYVAIYAVIAFFIIAFMFFKATILFFRGKSLFDDLEEDKKAKVILENIALKNQPITPAYGMYGQTPQNVYQNNQPNYNVPQQNFYQQNNPYPPMNNYQNNPYGSVNASQDNYMINNNNAVTNSDVTTNVVPPTIENDSSIKIKDDPIKQNLDEDKVDNTFNDENVIETHSDDQNFDYYDKGEDE